VARIKQAKAVRGSAARHRPGTRKHVAKPRKSKALAQQQFMRARFDVLQRTAENRKHWANADNLSPTAAVTPEKRRELRNCSRYEVANNSYARGIVLTLENDTVGDGPRLQMLTDDAELNKRIETAWTAWADAAELAAKLRTIVGARVGDGEAFGVITTNMAIASAVKVDLKLIEADMISAGFWSFVDPADGIEYDEFGNPARYRLLREHPGDLAVLNPFEGTWLPARYVLHWYRSDRAGQKRGIPELLPALPLFAQLRRYTLAVLGAAETAADLAVLLKTTMPNIEAETVQYGTEMDFEPRTATFLPAGWEAFQPKAEQPPTTYAEFKREILNEIARCLNMPYNIAACDSSDYNYASGRLDHQTYWRSLQVDQGAAERRVLDPMFAEWLIEYAAWQGIPTPVAPVHQWFWPGREHVDPEKEANAQDTRLKNLSTNYATEYAKQGRDWETEFRQIAKERELMAELDIEVPVPAKPAAPINRANDGDGDSGKGDGKPGGARSPRRSGSAAGGLAAALRRAKRF